MYEYTYIKSSVSYRRSYVSHLWFTITWLNWSKITTSMSIFSIFRRTFRNPKLANSFKHHLTCSICQFISLLKSNVRFRYISSTKLLVACRRTVLLLYLLSNCMLKGHRGTSPPYCVALSHQHSVSSFATLQILNCLHLLGLQCSCCDLEACNVATTASCICYSPFWKCSSVQVSWFIAPLLVTSCGLLHGLFLESHTLNITEKCWLGDGEISLEVSRGESVAGQSSTLSHLFSSGLRYINTVYQLCSLCNSNCSLHCNMFQLQDISTNLCQFHAEHKNL
jgi:hypothetical protein